ncbi:MAG: hypothetical protein GXO21_08590 [Aquificae bacterium]|nr:hypothetical protein [Aquificota bacterium]
MVIYILTALSVLIFGCAEKTKEVNKNIPPPPSKTEIEKPVVLLKPQTKPIILKKKPTLKKYDIFKGKFFTFSANEAPLSTVLYAISKDTNLNIIISPQVDKNITITANFNKTPLKYALDIIMKLTGLYYETVGNTIIIKELQTKTFKIPFIYTASNYRASLGGDVLGTALTMGMTTGGSGGRVRTSIGGASSSNLTGGYSLEYQTPEESADFYSVVEKNIKSLLSQKGKYVFNKTSGILIITDRKQNIDLVSKYIKKLKKELQKQVLIEARIIEVQLSDEYQFGVDWSILIEDILKTGANLTISQTLALNSGAGAISIQGSNFNTLINALKKVGEVKTLANPRIRVLNGQSALISTGKIVPFWEKQIQTIATQYVTQQVSFIRSSVLDGILLGVTVHIDENKNITMNIIPVSSRLEGVKQLKQDNQVVAEAPIVNIKETGTIIKAKDGDMIIIGGLISEDVQKLDEMVPKLSSLKYVGGLFRQKIRKKVKKELIIFLKPKIVGF